MQWKEDLVAAHLSSPHLWGGTTVYGRTWGVRRCWQTTSLTGQGRSATRLSSALPSPSWTWAEHLVNVSDWLILSCSSSARNPCWGVLSSCRWLWPPRGQLWGDEERNAVVLVWEGAWWPKWAGVHMLRAAGVQKRKKFLGNNTVEIPPCVCSLYFLHLCSYYFWNSWDLAEWTHKAGP